MADEDVKITLGAKNDDILSNKKKTICELCCKQFSKYTCPKCNARYCSTACYKSEKHLRCSEHFYKDCIMEALKCGNEDPEGKRKVLDMLKRLESDAGQQREDGLEVASLEERLADVDLDGDSGAVWASLTEDEKKEFESTVASGAISGMVDIWKPWWICGRNDKHRVKVEEIEIGEEQSSIKKKREDLNTIILPQVLRNIPSLKSMLKTTPNANVKFNITSVLYGYAYVIRLYNGCLDVPDQASENVLRLSPVLLRNDNFETVESVVISCLDTTRVNKDLFNTEEFSHSVLSDVVDILNGNSQCNQQRTSFVDIALSETHRLLERGRKILKQNSSQNTTEQELCKTLWLAKKKVYFLLAWSHENTRVLREMVPLLDARRTCVSLDHERHVEEKQKLEGKWGGVRPAEKRRLIEEV